MTPPIRVKLSTVAPDWPFARQTPAQSGHWENVRYLIDDATTECDYWVVYDDLCEPARVECPRENTILVTAEPPSVKRYPRGFVAQFGTVITCHDFPGHPRVLRTQQALPWHVGRRQRGHENLSFSLDYDALSAAPPPAKTRQLSVVCSNLQTTAGHRERLRFVEQLADALGADAIDVFGRGRREIEDKWDAIAPYRYHVVLENTAVPHYWTEKLADALLAGTYPFYYGCPNIRDYFSAGVLTPIDIHDPAGSIATIRETMARNAFDRSLAERADARRLVLDRYNLFPVLSELCRVPAGRGGRGCALRPMRDFAPARERLAGAARRIRRLIRRR